MWHNNKVETPLTIPECEAFGVEYEIKYVLPNGNIETMITEWLWDGTWNCIYPVLQWGEYEQAEDYSNKSKTIIHKHKMGTYE